jgi:RNA polymerase sigma-70 factor (ECF subfamily)
MGQVRKGCRSSLEKLVRRYASPLLTFIERTVGDRHRAEELFQEVFLSVWSKRRQYKLEHAFRSWLFTIAANRCRSHFRKQVTPTISPEIVDASPDRATSATETAIATETATMVTVAVKQLPPAQRMVVSLRVWNGLSFAKIAEVIGTAEGTARSTMHRALAAMRKSLEPKLS